MSLPIGIPDIGKLSINEEIQIPATNKKVKLQLTRIQFNKLIKAIEILEEYDFSDVIAETLGKVPGIKTSYRVTSQTIQKELIHPIIDLRNRVIPSTTSERTNSMPTLREYPATNSVKTFFALVPSDISSACRFNTMKTGTTCMSDVRSIQYKYIKYQNLKQDDGIIVFDQNYITFMQSFDDILKDNIDKKLIEQTNKRLYTAKTNSMKVIQSYATASYRRAKANGSI